MAYAWIVICLCLCEVDRMFLNLNVTGFRSFSRTHGRISMGALGRSSDTNPRKMSSFVSTSLPTIFHAFSTPFRDADGYLKVTSISSSLLIQISSLRRNKIVFPSVIYDPLRQVSCYTKNGALPSLPSTMTRLRRESRRSQGTHRTREPFYITPFHQKNPASREKYASELHQVMILRLSRVGRTSCYQMVSHGRVNSILFQNIILLFMKNWGKINLFQTTWTQLCRLCPQEESLFARVTLFIH